jgi:hypothetical protein
MAIGRILGPRLFTTLDSLFNPSQNRPKGKGAAIISMDTPKKDLTPLGDVIAQLMSDGTLPFEAEDADIWHVWDQVVGNLSAVLKPTRIRNKRLQVTVPDPIWLQEMRFSERRIREDLNRKLERTAVVKIDFRVGPQ